MTWKPKEYFSHEGHGNCPVCGTKISATEFLNDTLVVKTEDEPVDVSEPNYHCEGCGTDLVVDLVIKLIINSQVFKKQDLTSDPG